MLRSVVGRMSVSVAVLTCACGGATGDGGSETDAASTGDENSDATKDASGDGDGDSSGDGDATSDGDASGDGDACAGGLAEALSAEGITTHLEALQSFADANGGNRSAGGAGYDASAQYVFDQLSAAGYRPMFQEFPFVGFLENAPTIFEQIAPDAQQYLSGDDFFVVSGAANGDANAEVTAVDLDLGLGNNSTSGCEASDFTNFPAGNIALVQRGQCPFVSKFANAEAAGASGVVMFNQGDTANPDRQDAVSLSLSGLGVPAVFVSYSSGEQFAATIDDNALTLRIVVDAEHDLVTRNIIVETSGDASQGVTMMGAHLDSVAQGPGIQDNGSGSALLLEAALQFSQCAPDKRLRFAWWSAEEYGLVGSEHYVGELSPQELDGIARYLNFDMVASPNYVRFVLDGDGSDSSDAGPGESPALEQMFVDYFSSLGLETEPTQLDGRSDYGPFAEVGIAVGALFTGAEGIKTEAQATIYGGNAGEAYDPCYHRACDTVDNINETVLMHNAGALAHVIETYSTQ